MLVLPHIVRNALVVWSITTCASLSFVQGEQQEQQEGQQQYVNDISADSTIGKRLLSKAVRSVVENESSSSTAASTTERALNDNYYTSWMSSYSLKFAGCHSVPQFEKDEGMRSTLLARFMLCKSGSCSRCSDHGEYVIEMRDFLEAYQEALQEANEYECEQQLNQCEYLCQNGLYYNNGNAAEYNYNNNNGEGNYNGNYYYNNGDGNNNNNNNNNNNGENYQNNGDYDADYCQSECMYMGGYGYCNDDYNQNENLNMDEIGECQPLGEQNGGNNNRNNYYNNWGGDNGNRNSYQRAYVGAYCTSKGVYVGTFLDQMCTQFAPAGTYEKYMGYSLPSQALVTTQCISCAGNNYNADGANYYYDNNAGNNNGNYNAQNGMNGYGVSESCERLYEDAGKCERNLKDVQYKNNGACELIDHTLKNLDNAMNRGHVMRGKLSVFFAWVLFFLSLAMAGYIYFLHTRIIGSVNYKDAASSYFQHGR